MHPRWTRRGADDGPLWSRWVRSAFVIWMTTTRPIQLRPVHRASLYPPSVKDQRPHLWRFLPRTDPVVFTHAQFMNPTTVAATWSTSSGKVAIAERLIVDSVLVEEEDQNEPSYYGTLPFQHEVEKCWITPLSTPPRRRYFFILLDRASWTRALWEALVVEGSEAWTWRKIPETPIKGIPVLFRSEVLRDGPVLWILEAGGVLSRLCLSTTTASNHRFYNETFPGIASADLRGRILALISGQDNVVYVTTTDLEKEDANSSSMSTPWNTMIEIPTNISGTGIDGAVVWAHVGIQRVVVDLVESRWCVVCFLHTTSREGMVVCWKIEFFCRGGIPGKFIESVRSIQRLSTLQVSSPQQVFMGVGGRVCMVPPHDNHPSFRSFLQDSPVSIHGYPLNEDDIVQVPIGVGMWRNTAVQWSDHHVWFWELEDKLKNALRNRTAVRGSSSSIPMTWWTHRSSVYPFPSTPNGTVSQ